MFNITKAINRRVSHSIVEQIRDAIFSGELIPGDRLPSEKDLAEDFGVSKASLREAFRALEALGLLEIRQGMAGGAFVSKVDLETARNSLFNYIFFQNPSIQEFTQLRALIEPPVAELAAGRISDADIADLEENLAKTKKKLDADVFYYELDTYFHHRIAEIAGNSLICFVIDSLKNALVIMKQQLGLGREFSLNVFNSHQRILKALRDRDPARARHEMMEHIKQVEQELIAISNEDIQLNPNPDEPELNKKLITKSRKKESTKKRED
ncbi:MAG: FadR/GntR family transcriptional regulator [Desulfobacterales bacterium]|jgi:GntR family transcriptional repressor for pyruvate dehydrogenase complex